MISRINRPPPTSKRLLRRVERVELVELTLQGKPDTDLLT
jgi:hypothetical protein